MICHNLCRKYQSKPENEKEYIFKTSVGAMHPSAETQKGDKIIVYFDFGDDLRALVTPDIEADLYLYPQEVQCEQVFERQVGDECGQIDPDDLMENDIDYYYDLMQNTIGHDNLIENATGLSGNDKESGLVYYDGYCDICEQVVKL